MSFNKKYLPELPDLIEIRASYSSDEEFLDVFLRKVDAVIGLDRKVPVISSDDMTALMLTRVLAVSNVQRVVVRRTPVQREEILPTNMVLMAVHI